MKAFKIYCLLLLITVSLYNLQGQENCETEDLNNLMYKASTLNSDLLWDRSISTAKSAYEASNDSEDLLQLCYAYYGNIGTCLSNNDDENGEILVELGLEAAERLSLDSEYESIANALMAGFNGMGIAFSPMKGMVLGPKSDRQISKALKLDPENAIAWLQKGSSEYNTPRMFGGSVKNSIDSFKKSIECFEVDDSKPIWMKIEAMIWLGQAYHYVKDYENARKTYEAALEIAPNHGWIVQILLPATMAKLEK